MKTLKITLTIPETVESVELTINPRQPIEALDIKPMMHYIESFDTKLVKSDANKRPVKYVDVDKKEPCERVTLADTGAFIGKPLTSVKKKLYEKTCPECGKQFQTVRTHQVMCCRTCVMLHRHKKNPEMRHRTRPTSTQKSTQGVI